MKRARQETVVLTMPPEPRLARLARLATLHFLRQNGLTMAAARKSAGSVERRCLRMLRVASRTAMAGGGRSLILRLSASLRACEAVSRLGRGRAPRRLLRVERRVQA